MRAQARARVCVCLFGSIRACVLLTDQGWYRESDRQRQGKTSRQNVRQTETDLFSEPFRTIHSTSGVRWCGVLGFLPSSCSTLQLFQDSNRFCWLLYQLLGRSPSLGHVQDSTFTGVFECGCRTVTPASLGFPFHFSLFGVRSFNP